MVQLPIIALVPHLRGVVLAFTVYHPCSCHHCAILAWLSCAIAAWSLVLQYVFTPKETISQHAAAITGQPSCRGTTTRTFQEALDAASLELRHWPAAVPFVIRNAPSCSPGAACGLCHSFRDSVWEPSWICQTNLQGRPSENAPMFFKPVHMQQFGSFIHYLWKYKMVTNTFAPSDAQYYL